MIRSGFRTALLVVAAGIALAATVTSQSTDLATAPPAAIEANDAVPNRDPETLRLLYSRSVLTLNPHLASGYQDFEAARIVYEPLASYNEAGELVPFLADEIPTAENGGIAADGTSVTWTLRPDITWADGEPFTAADVVFTFEFIRNPVVAAATAQYYDGVKSVEAIDDYTVKVTFATPTPAWSVPFTGQTGLILPRHIFAEFNGPTARDALANLQPVGTGPYQVVGFESGTVVYEPNPSYWGGRPAFKRVELLGGLAPYAAAREVLQAGTADFAHNLQVEAEALSELETDASGHVTHLFGSQVERIMLNFSNPFARTEDGERSSPEIPHPYFSDVRVRQALNLAVDRNTIAKELYGTSGKPTAQLLVAPANYQSPDISYSYNLAQAKALLNEAGWVDSNGDGLREKDGVPLEVLFQAAVNPVRQKTQAIVSDSLQELGVDVQIARVRMDEFFSGNPEDTGSLNHFYADMQVYSIGNESPDPSIYMGWWTCDKIASQANQWQEPNNARYCNPEYDRLWEEARQELDPDRRAALFQQMNELLAQDVAVIPVVHRAMTNAVSDRLTGVEFTPWDASTWAIADWSPKPAQPEQ
ncbi:peptide ABC transporter substrate-binding protein [Phormidium tenue]|uniref:Peptide ABC transporter substrate-binding protein n=1 Tax=Phormidium tenue NIES-30 TaxID=549789 RepID=A0A1U7J124_9CYAN|nr:peptide ABC transporter substrate-binding protein [Phormidium tenue]MBD2233986.1 peptide ABC transporter substrate-binding protein [Phormidium tenue FACHB-1052]OKH45405.1 peptide ABC transporter substrate-binding protein [Phormidium tenue NIES-30]